LLEVRVSLTNEEFGLGDLILIYESF